MASYFFCSSYGIVSLTWVLIYLPFDYNIMSHVFSSGFCFFSKVSMFITFMYYLSYRIKLLRRQHIHLRSPNCPFFLST